MVVGFAEFCSNPKCNYKTTYNLIPGPEDFCTRCGEPMIVKCPKCAKDFPNKTEIHCPSCGARIKKVE